MHNNSLKKDKYLFPMNNSTALHTQTEVKNNQPNEKTLYINYKERNRPSKFEDAWNQVSAASSEVLGAKGS